MGYVYLLMSTDSDGEKELFKIGITKNNPMQRIKSLSTGNPNRIQLINFYESKNYLKVEKWFHSKYILKKSAADNEWFILEDSDVKNFTNDCKKADNIINLLLEDNYFFQKS